MHIVCVGHLMVDVVARLPGPLAIGSDTPAPIALLGGGAAANVAAWAAAAGVQATFVGRVGDDELGRSAVADLVAGGVEVAVDLAVGESTGTCIVLVAPDGERTMIPAAGANSGLGAGRPASELLPAVADWLYLSGYVLLDPTSRPFALDALRHARRRRWAIAVDAASAAPLAEHAAGQFLRLVGHDVVLLANDAEAEVLTGYRGARAALALAAHVGEAVVKSGADGAVWSDGVDTGAITPEPAPVIDSTGAGDAFAAGYLGAGPPAAIDVDARLGAAARLAARAVGVVGARPVARRDRGGT